MVYARKNADNKTKFQKNLLDELYEEFESEN